MTTIVANPCHMLRQRATQIATIAWANGFRWLVAVLGLRGRVEVGCRLLCSGHLRQRHPHVEMDLPLPDRMRRVLETLVPRQATLGR